ncbi:S-adenosyl-L-methionine-dependent methyltransferase [Baffinella frigidus]|nr:S-adenosyl-L-methionine-dependent methyltransferase [Cryptophyta sp. CCMP2293]
MGHHNVLDMCAAPGSKTTQVLGLLPAWRAGFVSTVMTSKTTQVLGLLPALREGILIANDPNSERLARLRSRLQKETDARGAVITSFDARLFPAFPSTPFHRILADVPCSGDGMLRRLPRSPWDGMLRRLPRTLPFWTPSQGCRLHPTQAEILARALALLPPGGRVVYSTCSLNPVEDEAVVAHALATAPYPITLEPIPSLPGVKLSSGLRTWLVPRSAADASLSGFFASFDEVPEAALCEQEGHHAELEGGYSKVPEAALASGRVTRSMFPPPEGSEEAAVVERFIG